MTHYLTWILAPLIASLVDAAHTVQESFTLNPLEREWNALSKEVDGRLFEGVPFAHPCFAMSFDSPDCLAVRSSYVDPVARGNVATAYMQTQWETCQVRSDQCLLSSSSPNDTSPIMSPNKCRQGSVPERFIDVQSAQDVAAAFRFSKKTGVPLVIKNTGHDYAGRSSAPRSLVLWTHKLKHISYEPAFVPEGCSRASPAVTVGAGVQWRDAYAFAENNNITVVGGSDRSVGVAGGWLQGGGHGMLSKTMGLGVDRVLQYKVVTPDGRYRVVNECQNEDLFFALRGGGGGTFGVVLESTILASPRLTLQTIVVKFTPTVDRNTELWTMLADNGQKWAEEGWGGSSMSGFVILVNPRLNKEEAVNSVKPLIQYGERLQSKGVAGVQMIVTEFSSWGSFFDTFSRDYYGATVGQSLALASRLVDINTLTNYSTRSALVSALLAADANTPGLIIFLAGPTSLPYYGRTSVTDAWRSSVYHVVVTSSWEWNATTEEKRSNYTAVSRSMEYLRRITPDAAYLNEADVYEPNHEVAFWGKHYPELLQIKQKYDPHHLLDCWHCVGWNPKSPRFSCYLGKDERHLGQ